jgi:hypothetical protein
MQTFDSFLGPEMVPHAELVATHHVYTFLPHLVATSRSDPTVTTQPPLHARPKLWSRLAE